MDQDWSKLRKWLIKKRPEGKSVTAICVEAQVDRKMFYRWWSRYQAHGWKGLEEKARGRPVGPGIDDSLKQKVIKLRKRYEWGPNKIAGCLNRKGFSIDHNQAYHIICEAGLNHQISGPRKTWRTKRFQREHNNSLWQADFRLCSDSARYTSEFDRHCRELGIEHITASVGRPTTCGKIEAFHKAYEVESHLFKEHWSFIRYYNYIRPHEGLNYLTPAEIYLKGKV